MIEVALQQQKGGFRLEASFAVAAQGVTGIFGPSGCGKTSVLRALAGLEPALRGRIQIGQEQWQEGATALAPERRRVGYVFQDPLLFPHLSVRGNLLYARKRSKHTRHLFELDELIAMLELESLADRGVAFLSGGERQRVAIARALAASPALLLLDEPLSALDQNARMTLISILEKVFQQLEIPVIYVSHSSDEIARLADNLVLMREGRVTACGPMHEVLGHVDGQWHESDAAFSVLHCRVRDHDLPHLTTLTSAGGESLHVPRQDLSDSDSLRLRIQARDVSLCLEKPEKTSILNILPATVQEISTTVAQGSRTVRLDVAGENLLARVSEHSVQQLQLSPGMKLYAQIKSVALLS